MTEDAYASLARQYGLTPAEIRAIGDALASAHGLVSREDFAAGMASIVATYTSALGETPSTFPIEHQESARIVVERAVEVIVARLEQTTQPIS
ncbi:MAG: hypothetical protein JWP26_46 [Devosia sp.]|uniref:hypothetical protein n=1 Tax=Devosia sp. TaxID=1871048 RepID=UPI00260623F5|nr:hypothetical protein [Devosia sp.]MDB5585076.1 hypothetical protein [Devosia sp.]